MSGDPGAQVLHKRLDMAAQYLRQPLYLLHCVRADLANNLPGLNF